MSASFKHLTIESRGHVAIVTFNRPEKLNALSVALMEEIERAALSFHEDENTRVVVFTGAGKHFTAGADLADPEREKRMKASQLMKWRQLRIGPRMIRAIYEMNQITIAAINGGALGGGACIATACDFRMGAEDSFVSYPEINLAMNLSWVGLPLCVHLVGPARAKRLVILGQREKAETLREWGFLDEVVSKEELIERAMAMAEAYAAQPPFQSQMIKRSVNAIASALDQAVMHMDTDQFMLASGTEDHAEAVKAFFEKRKAEFKGN